MLESFFHQEVHLVDRIHEALREVMRVVTMVYIVALGYHRSILQLQGTISKLSKKFSRCAPQAYYVNYFLFLNKKGRVLSSPGWQARELINKIRKK